MQGKRVLITGGNGGIGKVTAVELAKLGAEVVVASRESQKTTDAMAEISSHGSAVHLPVDLASLASVRALARTFLDRYDRLDVLINNAGVFPLKLTLTEDGVEAQFGVNHLAHFLLTMELLDCLKASAPSRVVTVTSKLHKGGAIDFDNLRGEGKYSAQSAYGQSKLANVLFGVELARRLEGTGVTSNLVHPGAVRTDIMRSLPGFIRWLVNLRFIPVEEGAKTSVMLASDPSFEAVTGAYYDQCEADTCADTANDDALRARLWSESETMTVASASSDT
ncbi:MAG: short-chain dehydrogenase [Gammaproteobacteria bacterium]|nr:short-chain dehydrogenase [Gammaproteobacteria bacterium]